MKKFLTLAIMAMAVAVVLSACGTESKIKGTWEEDSVVDRGGDAADYTFEDGGKYTHSDMGGLIEKGKYKVEGKKIKLDDKHNTVITFEGDKIKAKGKTYKKKD
ncbi:MULTISPECIES: hypothetical protein [Staphylococcus]|uniref:Lipoprotein n=1 Tax=Staphylococcus warneri TaxID=1292 RepID=A0AB36BJX4_STAWA|nr:MULTISPECIES: hypothetical protein [Staphylococcus]EAC3257020.1 hypothetical protein [Listeria monocytogenes]MEB7435553.1 hypothetical protein [Staphylococcus pasteuri]NBH31648.1 hypothetical protein [Staphylococcus warneri]